MCTLHDVANSREFFLLIFFFIIQYGTRARMSQSGRNILFGRFYLLLKADTFSQLTRPGKNELPFPDRFTSGELHSLLVAQIARKSRYVSAIHARINNGVNERLVSHSADFLSAIRPGASTRLVRSSLESTAPGTGRWILGCSEVRERLDRSIDRSIANFNVLDRSPTADRSG